MTISFSRRSLLHGVRFLDEGWDDEIFLNGIVASIPRI